MKGAYHKMKGSAHKEMRAVLAEAHRLGWEIKRWNKHCQLHHPDFSGTFTVPGSPRNPTFARKQMIKRLRRYPYKTTSKT